MRKLVLLVIALLLALAWSSTVLAQDPGGKSRFDRINEVAQELNCPTCAGINLADCRTLTCEQWREQIGELLDEGYSKQEILDYFVERYGTQVLQEPPRSGYTLILWVLPVLALLVGGGWLFYTLRGWSAQRQLAAAATREPPADTVEIDTAAPTDDYLSQVEQDLELD